MGACRPRCAAGAGGGFYLHALPLCVFAGAHGFGERAPQLLEAARLPGAPLSARLVASGAAAGWRVQPWWQGGAGADGNLADYGVVSYFGIQTLPRASTAWLVMDNRIAAATAGYAVLRGWSCL